MGPVVSLHTLLLALPLLKTDKQPGCRWTEVLPAMLLSWPLKQWRPVGAVPDLGQHALSHLHQVHARQPSLCDQAEAVRPGCRDLRVLEKHGVPGVAPPLVSRR